jgi:hypothetical protein
LCLCKASNYANTQGFAECFFPEVSAFPLNGRLLEFWFTRATTSQDMQNIKQAEIDVGPINAEMYHLNWRWFETDDEYFEVSKAHHYQGRWMVYGVHLPDEVLKKIYYQNAEKLYPGM